MINSVNLIGRLTKDVELKKSSTGVSIANLTLAVDTGKDDTSFIPCLAFKELAEALNKYTAKGFKLGVSGRLQQRTYQNKDGKNVSVVEVVIDRAEFCDVKKEEKTEPVTNQDIIDDTSMDDLPF